MVATALKKYALIFWFLGCLLMDYLTLTIQSYITYIGVIGHFAILLALLINDIDTLEMGLYTYIFTLYCNIVGVIVFSVFIGDPAKTIWIGITGGYLLTTGLLSLFLTMRYIQDQKSLLLAELNTRTKFKKSYSQNNFIFNSNSDIERHWKSDNERVIIDRPRFPEIKIEELLPIRKI